MSCLIKHSDKFTLNSAVAVAITYFYTIQCKCKIHINIMPHTIQPFKSTPSWFKGLTGYGFITLPYKIYAVFALYLSSAGVNNDWNYTSTSPICFHGVDRNNFNPFTSLSAVHKLYKEWLSFNADITTHRPPTWQMSEYYLVYEKSIAEYDVRLSMLCYHELTKHNLVRIPKLRWNM